MKRLALIFGLAVFGLCVYAQSSTIKDYGDYILLEYDHGDTVVVPKDGAFLERISGVGFKIHLPQPHIPATVRDNLLRPHYSEFGYANDTVMCDYLKDVFMQNYSVSYAYEATYGGPDSIWYKVGSDTAYIWVGTYSGDSLATSTIVPQ